MRIVHKPLIEIRWNRYIQFRVECWVFTRAPIGAKKFYRIWRGRGRKKHPTFGRWCGMQINFWDGYFFQDGVGQKKRSCKCTPATPKWAPFDIFSSKKVIHILKRIILFHRMKNNDKAKVILKNNTSKKQFAIFFPNWT